MRAVRIDRDVAPFAGDGLRAGDDFPFINDAAAAARAHDDAEDKFLSPPGSVKGLRHGETVRVVLDFDFAAQAPFEIGLKRLAIQAHGIGILEQSRAARNGPRRADAERVRRVMNGRGQFAVKTRDTLQNVRVAILLFRFDAFAKNFRALGVQDDAFDFGAAEVNADTEIAMHVAAKYGASPPIRQ
jgi:hypothetical protein